MDEFSSTFLKATESLPQSELNDLLTTHGSLFEDLPNEALLYVLNKMNLRTLAKTCKASVRLRMLCEENGLKKTLKRRENVLLEKNVSCISSGLTYCCTLLLKYRFG